MPAPEDHSPIDALELRRAFGTFVTGVNAAQLRQTRRKQEHTQLPETTNPDDR